MMMMKLYTSREHPGHWIAYVPEAGWLSFPNRENGWAERRPARGLDPIHLRQVPVQMATGTGMQAPESQSEWRKVA
jgi:hypothetical protein